MGESLTIGEASLDFARSQNRSNGLKYENAFADRGRDVDRPDLAFLQRENQKQPRWSKPFADPGVILVRPAGHPFCTAGDSCCPNSRLATRVRRRVQPGFGARWKALRTRDRQLRAWILVRSVFARPA